MMKPREDKKRIAPSSGLRPESDKSMSTTGRGNTCIVLCNLVLPVTPSILPDVSGYQQYVSYSLITTEVSKS
jgi:hypothetical protein